MTTKVTVKQRIAELVRQHGGYRAAGEVVGISRSRLWEIVNDRRGAGDVVLRALGLDPETATYNRLTGSRDGSKVLGRGEAGR